MADIWEQDELGYQSIGEAFTNLVKTIDDAKVLSIEAGFGRGKTFFRKAWAEHLRENGEIVIEVDVQQSDHSGDPVVTLLGALVASLPEKEDGRSKQAFESAKKIAALGTKTITKVLLKSAADEVIEAITDGVKDQTEDFDMLSGVIDNFGKGMSKAAGQAIAAQMSAENVRTKELPEQLETLLTALTSEADTERVIIIIDELDRCHPDYAIAVLESMKLVFNMTGFVFCLMINADYLEKLAQHRFGTSTNDEKYLDKFVDIRLKLEPHPENFKNAIKNLALEIPLAIPFGEDENFSPEHAADLAAVIAEKYNFSMRKTKRILLKVELALRCYADRPLDASLLVFLAFQNEIDNEISQDLLPRTYLTPEQGIRAIDKEENDRNKRSDRDIRGELDLIAREKVPDLLNLPADRYILPDDRNYYDWAKVFKFLAPHYIPSHQNVLNAVAQLSAD